MYVFFFLKTVICRMRTIFFNLHHLCISIFDGLFKCSVLPLINVFFIQFCKNIMLNTLSESRNMKGFFK